MIQEGPEGQRQGQGRELLLQRGAHDPVAVHGACGQTAVLRAGCRLPTTSAESYALQATSDTTSQTTGFQTRDLCAQKPLLAPKDFSPGSDQLTSLRLSAQ